VAGERDGGVQHRLFAQGRRRTRSGAIAVVLSCRLLI
jgi:hypothetical protein